MTIHVASTEITESEDVVPSYHFGHALVKQLWKHIELDTFVALQTLQDPKYQEKRQLRSGNKVSIIKLAVRDFS